MALLLEEIPGLQENASQLDPLPSTQILDIDLHMPDEQQSACSTPARPRGIAH